jgi:tape measure domain-containing protein
MAEDITRLVLKVESTQVELATQRLLALTRAAKLTSTSIGTMADKSNRVAANMRKINLAVGRTDTNMLKLGKSTNLTATQLSKLRLGAQTTAVTGYTRGVKGATKATAGFGVVLNSVLGPLAMFYATLSGVRVLLTTTAEYEKFNVQLEQVTGSAEAAATEMNFLRRVARENALVLKDTVAPYTRMAESIRQLGMDAEQARQLFIGVSNAAATFGMSADEVNGILVAFSQVASKGRVQAEELRNQIGERIPGAFSLAAKALGVTTAELNKQLELGLVDSAKFIRVYSEALQQEFGDNLADKTDTLGASWRRLSTAATELTNELSLLFSIGQGASSATKAWGDFFNYVSNELRYLREEKDKMVLVDLAEQMSVFSVGAKRAVTDTRAAFMDLRFKEVSDEFQEMIEEMDVTALNAQTGLISMEVKKLNDEIRNLKDERKNFTFGDVLHTDLGMKIQEASNKAKILKDMLVEVRDKRDEAFATPNGDVAGGSAEEVAVNSSKWDNFDEAEMERVETSFARLEESLYTEEEAIQASWRRRMDIAANYAALTGKNVDEIERKITADRDKKIKDLEVKKWKDSLVMFDNFQDNMLILAKTGNKELGAIYKVGAIANATIKTYEAANVALASAPPPFGAVLAGVAVAAGMANVAAIASQDVGSYASGGIVPGNNFNGDNLTANVNSGEMILNYSQQRHLLDMAEGGHRAESKPVIVNVIGAPADDIEVSQSETNEARIIEIAVTRSVDKINDSIRTGRGDTERALQTRDKRRR